MRGPAVTKVKQRNARSVFGWVTAWPSLTCDRSDREPFFSRPPCCLHLIILFSCKHREIRRKGEGSLLQFSRALGERGSSVAKAAAAATEVRLA